MADNKIVSRWLNETGKKLDACRDQVAFLELALLRAFDNDELKVKEHLSDTKKFMFRDLDKFTNK